MITKMLTERRLLMWMECYTNGQGSSEAKQFRLIAPVPLAELR
jgi:hypothetical protein